MSLMGCSACGDGASSSAPPDPALAFRVSVFGCSFPLFFLFFFWFMVFELRVSGKVFFVLGFWFGIWGLGLGGSGVLILSPVFGFRFKVLVFGVWDLWIRELITHVCGPCSQHPENQVRIPQFNASAKQINRLRSEFTTDCHGSPHSVLRRRFRPNTRPNGYQHVFVMYWTVLFGIIETNTEINNRYSSSLHLFAIC